VIPPSQPPRVSPFYSFQPGTLPPTNNNSFADYPTLGVDANALYIGANIFGSVFYKGTEGYVVNKSDLLAGTLTVTAFRNFASGSGNGMFPHREWITTTRQRLWKPRRRALV